MSRHLIAFTAAIALAGCSAGMTAEAVQEAYLPPEDATLVQELGSSEISLERGASFRAVLKVRAGGREVCRDIRS